MKLRYAILVLLAFAAGWFCTEVVVPAVQGMNSAEAVVQVEFPESYEFVGPAVLRGNAFVTIHLRDGLRVLRFSRAGQQFAAVLSVEGGGEIYMGLEEKDIRPIVPARELRD